MDLRRNQISRKAEISAKVRILIKDTGLPLSLASEAMGISASAFMRWWSCGQAAEETVELTINNLVSLGKFLRVDEDQIMTGTYNKEFVRGLLFKRSDSLPERYSRDQFSFLRSSAHIIRYVEMTRGQHFCDKILRGLNVSPIIYRNLENKINLTYFIDLLESLSQHGFSQTELDSLASVLFLGIGETSLGYQFKSCQTYQQCFKTMGENLRLFDDNFEYSYELDQKRFILKAFLSYDKHSKDRLDQVDLGRLFKYREILAGWFPYLANLTPIMPKTTLISSRDGIMATYNIDFGESEFFSPLALISNQ